MRNSECGVRNEIPGKPPQLSSCHPRSCVNPPMRVRKPLPCGSGLSPRTSGLSASAEGTAPVSGRDRFGWSVCRSTSRGPQVCPGRIAWHPPACHFEQRAHDVCSRAITQELTLETAFGVVGLSRLTVSAAWLSSTSSVAAGSSELVGVVSRAGTQPAAVSTGFLGGDTLGEAVCTPGEYNVIVRANRPT